MTPLERGVAWGRCALISAPMVDKVGLLAFAIFSTDIPVDLLSGDAILRTQADFGCVHFEAE